MSTLSVPLKDALGTPKYTITKRKMLNMIANSCKGPDSLVEKETEASKGASAKREVNRAADPLPSLLLRDCLFSPPRSLVPG